MPLCKICADFLGYDLDVSALPCGHTLHRSCLEKWSNVAKRGPTWIWSTCPKCRKLFAQKQVVKKLFFERMDGIGGENGVDLHRKLEVLESSLTIKENEAKVLRGENETLEAELNEKEIYKLNLSEQLNAVEEAVDTTKKKLKRCFPKLYIKEILGEPSHSFDMVLRETTAKKRQRHQELQSMIRQKEETVKKLEEGKKQLTRRLIASKSKISLTKLVLKLTNKKLNDQKKFKKKVLVSNSIRQLTSKSVRSSSLLTSHCYCKRRLLTSNDECVGGNSRDAIINSSKIHCERQAANKCENEENTKLEKKLQEVKNDLNILSSNNA